MKYILALLVSAFAVTSFAQELSKESPLEGATQVAYCFGIDQPIQVIVALDDAGLAVLADFNVLDPNTGSAVNGSYVALNSLVVSDDVVSLDGALSDWGNVSLVLSSVRASSDETYVDEDSNEVSIPTYSGTVTISDGTQEDILNVQCYVQAL